MAQLISKGNIFGRIGSGIGRGLADQIPKEIERSRLQSGLKEVGQAKDQTPFQQFAALSSVPGVTPQMIQSGSELLRQQARGQALAQQNRPKESPFPQRQQQTQSQKPSDVPSLTKEDVFAKAQEGYIPPTIEERDSIAGEAYNSNPAFFANDPQKAIDWADSKIAQEEKIAQANQIKHENLSKIQDNVINRLKDQSSRLNAEIPAELYSKIEDEAIQATKTKKEGGKGLTEQQAIKEYGEKLNNASRDFAKINEVGDWGISLRPAKDSLRSLKELQNTMEKLGQTDNFAKKLISQNKLSPKLAYAIAEPVSKIPELNSTLAKIPPIVNTRSEDPKYETQKIAPVLSKFLKENEKASPLAIAHELEKKGYDVSAWLQYVTDHAPELNLRQRQSEQAATPINIIKPWNDWWLSIFSGLE